jgi:membrane protein
MFAPPMLTALRRAITGARDAIKTRAGDVWRRDRAGLRGGRALTNRISRIAIVTLRGISVHGLGLQAAALTYYTVFSLVPLLVVVLWVLKTFDRLSIKPPAMPVATAVTKGNAALHGLLQKLFENVNHTTQVTSGIVGLVALLYAVVRLFLHTERALDLIAASTKREAKLSRLFGYLALLLLPPLLGLVAGLLTGAIHHTIGSEVSRLVGSTARLKIAFGATLGLTASWLAVSIFYSAAARARIAFSSAAVGGAAATILLSTVLWVFAEFQIGMSRGNSVQFGATAGPVFLLWAFVSWFVVLLGAEIAVGHSVDRVLVHGAWCFRLDAVAEQETGVEIMVRAARASVCVDDLARELRVAPQLIREIAARLVERGLLVDAGLDWFTLAGKPERIGVADIMDAVARNPDLDAARQARLDQHRSARVVAALASRPIPEVGPTLQELAGQPAPGPVAAGELTGQP